MKSQNSSSADDNYKLDGGLGGKYFYRSGFVPHLDNLYNLL